MEEKFKRIFKKFEEEVSKLNQKRTFTVQALKVVMLGQQALLIRSRELIGMTLLATTDFDAKLKGEVPLEDIFKRCLRDEGISYDEQSNMIWMPEETEYEELYRSDSIVVTAPLPVYLLVSKALYAKEKNRQLIIDAVAQEKFGTELLQLMEKHKVDMNYFFGSENEE